MEKFTESLGTQVNIVARSMRLALEKEISSLGISPSGWMMLMALGEKGHQAQSDLGRMVNLDNATITRILDKLGEMGLIVRNQNKDDRRVQFVSLTAKGRKVYREWNELGRKVNRRALENISDSDIKKLIELLHTIRGNLNAMNGH